MNRYTECLRWIRDQQPSQEAAISRWSYIYAEAVEKGFCVLSGLEVDVTGRASRRVRLTAEGLSHILSVERRQKGDKPARKTRAPAPKRGLSKP